MEGTRRTRLRQASVSIACVQTLDPFLVSRSSSDRCNQQNPIAFLEGAGFSAKEADVFFIEVDVEELADLALIVADVAPEIGEARGKLVEGVGDRGRATINFRRAIGEATEGCGNFNGYGHLILLLRFQVMPLHLPLWCRVARRGRPR